MANPDSAFGLMPAYRMGGGDLVVRRCNVASGEGNVIGIGDAVTLDGTGGSVVAGHSYTGVQRAAAGGRIFGVMVGKCDSLHDDPVYRAASTSTDILVCVATPDTVFHIQEDDADGNVLTIAAIGGVADIVVTAAASTTTGRSNMELDRSTHVAATTDASLRLLRPADVVRNGLKNALGASCVWEVMLAESNFATGYATGQ